ncbi:double zinc ribbon protein [Homoserinimonas aerilata]|uniref:Double zinc ribbon protein n=1 Tax=Homoserinimonas aerilata TaxID=1162970 RepID=A0A542YKL6_9MICO|nr:zinc-ribbon domain-containing protein [Homoserinimonas aerilata]TQL48484.1 double zinc ribbon protein [Homoserinimonas aerilata]
MNCSHCGTRLPRGALFCGECGRRIEAGPAGGHPADEETGPASRSIRPDDSQPFIAPPPAERAHPAPVVPGSPAGSSSWVLSDFDDELDLTGEPEPAVSDASPESSDDAPAGTAVWPLRCEQCGNLLGPGDIFCGECGFVSRAVTQAFTMPIERIPSAPSISEPPVRGAADEMDDEMADAPAEVDPGADDSDGESIAPLPPSPSVPFLPPVGLIAPEPPAAAAVPLLPAPGLPVPMLPEALIPPPQTKPARASVPLSTPEVTDDLAADLEETRIVRRRGAERFVLQFSTGESVTVYGTGLIGRNPRPEPGEVFDQLVRVLDTGRSVSKTHLEFGQQGGVFWVKDRFSGNGTIVRAPESEPQRCEAERRYSVVRGSRVEIGEQFFIVS